MVSKWIVWELNADSCTEPIHLAVRPAKLRITIEAGSDASSAALGCARGQGRHEEHQEDDSDQMRP
jgi:hypothetical protein